MTKNERNEMVALTAKEIISALANTPYTPDVSMGMGEQLLPAVLAALRSVIPSAVNQQEINACEERCCKNAPNAVGLSLSPPWILYAAEVKKLFELDEAVSVGGVVDGDDGKTVHIRTPDHWKADALYGILKSPVRFGNVELRITVHDDSGDDSPVLLETDEDKINAAFDGNRLFRGVRRKNTSDGFDRGYLVMDSTPVQFWGDNLASYRGLITMLPEQIAADVLEIPGMGICTADLRENERRCNDGEGRLSENGGK